MIITSLRWHRRRGIVYGWIDILLDHNLYGADMGKLLRALHQKL